jgi:glycine/D-amino acid oxidase-like deaminating enzyme
MSETADAVIIGAGIVGAACAETLSREGLRVVVIDSGDVGLGATAAGMGHIVVMDESEAEFRLTRYSRDLWQKLAASLPPEAEYEACGTLWVARDEEEMTAVRRKAAFYSSRGVPAEILDAAALAEAEPHLRPGLAGGLLIPDDTVIYAPCAARWLIEQALRRGAALRLGARVTGLERDGVRLGDGSQVSTGLTICAAGSLAGELVPGIGVRPRKGHLAITDRYPGFVRRQLVELGYLRSAHGSAAESVAFNVQPRKTGQILIGSSRQFGVVHAAVDSPILGRMLQRAIEFMPALAGLSVIRTWTGFRAATDDRLPLIGPCPGRESAYLATGHEGLGITTSLATAELLAALILGQPPAIAAEPYLPSRLRELTHA